MAVPVVSRTSTALCPGWYAYLSFFLFLSFTGAWWYVALRAGARAPLGMGKYQVLVHPSVNTLFFWHSFTSGFHQPKARGLIERDRAEFPNNYFLVLFCVILVPLKCFILHISFPPSSLFAPYFFLYWSCFYSWKDIRNILVTPASLPLPGDANVFSE